MTRKIRNKDFESVLSLPAQRRYEHFIKRVADWGTVWSIGDDDGWVLMGDSQGREVVPVWPHERYAAACVSGKWAGNQPRPIPIGEWLEKWTPGKTRDGRLVAVFPSPTDSASVVSPDDLRADLEEELANLIQPDEEEEQEE